MISSWSKDQHAGYMRVSFVEAFLTKQTPLGSGTTWSLTADPRKGGAQLYHEGMEQVRVEATEDLHQGSRVNLYQHPPILLPGGFWVAIEGRLYHSNTALLLVRDLVVKHA